MVEKKEALMEINLEKEKMSIGKKGKDEIEMVKLLGHQCSLLPIPDHISLSLSLAKLMLIGFL